MKKKIFVVLLALVLVFSLSTMALATDKVFTVSVNGEDAASYTMEELKSLGIVTQSIYSLNSFGTEETKDYTGVLLSSILNDSGFTGVAKEYVFAATDGFNAKKDAALMTADYKDKCKPMIAIKDDGTLQLIIPQAAADEVNKSAWVSKLASLNITTEGASTGGEVIVKPADTPAFTRCIISNQKLTVNGKAITCTVYNIDGNNYFKLRDLALALKDTAAKFSIDYDSVKRVVTATSGQSYVADGSEWTTGVDKSATCVPSSQGALFNGVASTAYAYNIGGNNFFKLRDLGTAFSFNVDYDEATRTMLVTTSDSQGKDNNPVEPTGDALITINNVGYTLAQLQACSAQTMIFAGKEGNIEITGAKISDLVGSAIPDGAITILELDRYNGPNGYKILGSDFKDAIIGYLRNGEAFTDEAKNMAGVTADVAVYYTNAAGTVVQCKLIENISW